MAELYEIYISISHCKEGVHSSLRTPSFFVYYSLLVQKYFTAGSIPKRVLGHKYGVP